MLSAEASARGSSTSEVAARIASPSMQSGRRPTATERTTVDSVTGRSSVESSAAADRLISAVRASPDPASRAISARRGNQSWALRRSTSISRETEVEGVDGGDGRSEAEAAGRVAEFAAAAAMGRLMSGSALSRHSSLISSGGSPRRGRSLSGARRSTFGVQRSMLSQEGEMLASRTSSFADLAREESLVRLSSARSRQQSLLVGQLSRQLGASCSSVSSASPPSLGGLSPSSRGGLLPGSSPLRGGGSTVRSSNATEDTAGGSPPRLEGVSTKL